MIDTAASALLETLNNTKPTPKFRPLPKTDLRPVALLGLAGIGLGCASTILAIHSYSPSLVPLFDGLGSSGELILSVLLAAGLATFVVAGIIIRRRMQTKVSNFYLEAIRVVEESGHRRQAEVSGPFQTFSAGYRVRSRFGTAVAVFLGAQIYAAWIWTLDSICGALGIGGTGAGIFVLTGGVLFAVAAYFSIKRLQSLIPQSIARGNYETALRLLTRFERFGLSSLTKGRGAVLVQSGRYGEAERWLRGQLLVDRDIQQTQALFQYAQALHGLGDFELAAKLYEACELFLPNSPYPIIGRAEVMLERHEEPGEALSLLQTAYQNAEIRTPELSALYFGRTAGALDLLKKPESANQALERAFDALGDHCRPLFVRLLYIKAELLFGRSRVSEAIATLKECLKLEPKGPISTRAKLLLLAASSIPANEEQYTPASYPNYRN